MNKFPNKIFDSKYLANQVKIDVPLKGVNHTLSYHHFV
jgi:hypothetical protein